MEMNELFIVALASLLIDLGLVIGMKTTKLGVIFSFGFPNYSSVHSHHHTVTLHEKQRLCNFYQTWTQ